MQLQILTAKSSAGKVCVGVCSLCAGPWNHLPVEMLWRLILSQKAGMPGSAGAGVTRGRSQQKAFFIFTPGPLSLVSSSAVLPAGFILMRGRGCIRTQCRGMAWSAPAKAFPRLFASRCAFGRLCLYGTLHKHAGCGNNYGF